MLHADAAQRWSQHRVDSQIVKVFLGFGERGACNREEVILDNPKLAQELAVKLARVFGRTSFYEIDFLVTRTIPRQSWIGDTHYVGVGIKE